MIELFKVFMHPRAHEDVKQVLHSGYIGEGSLVRTFERKIASIIDNPYVLCVNSGTSALVLALRLLPEPKSNIVLSTPMTCLATNMAIHESGRRVEWVDVDPQTGLMDPEDAEKRCGKHHDAIMCMHWGGNPCDVYELRRLGPPIIEDACQALGSTRGSLPIGQGSFAVAFSFQAIKTLTCGDGGALSLMSRQSYDDGKLMRWFGLDRELAKDMRCGQDPPFTGYKMQMNNISAAIGLANARCLEQNLEKSARIVNQYKELLDGHKYIDLVIPRHGTSSNWLCTVLVDDSEKFIKFMHNKGIACSKVHDRNDTKKIFAYARRDLPGVSEFDRRHVCIPCGWWLEDGDVFEVKDALGDYHG